MNSGSFTVLGFINPYNAGGLTAAQFFDYNNPSFNAFSYNGEQHGGPIPVSRKTQLFFADTSTGLGFFVVHDRAGDGSGGSASMTFFLVGDTANIAGDEPGEVTSSAGGTQFDLRHTWRACCTDGARIGSLDGLGWTLFGQFNSAPSGINGWGALDNNGSVLPLVLSAQQVRFRPVPEPGTLAIVAIGLAGLGVARRKRTI